MARSFLLVPSSLLLAACAEAPPPPERASASGLGRLGTEAAWQSAQALSVTAIAWGDRDADGDLDLAVGVGSDAFEGGNRDLVWDADRGSLSVAWTSPGDEPTTAVAWGDRDGDGDLDLAVGAGAAFSGLNVPDRVFDASGGSLVQTWEAWDPAVSSGSAVTSSLAWGDLDGDGDLDLVQARRGYPTPRGTSGHGLTVLLGPDLLPGWSPPTAVEVEAVAVGDLDGDGDADLVEAGDPTRIWRNDGNLAFTLAWTDPSGRTAQDVALGDIDGDGDLDLALADTGSPSRVFRNSPAGFSLVWSTPTVEPSVAADWGDVDGDGDLDLALANDRAPVTVFENTGPAFAPLWSSPSIVATDLAWGDWDGDGDPDLAVAGRQEPLRIFANGGSAARLVILPAEPGEAGETSQVRVIGATPGATLTLFAAEGPGSVAAPGCAGVRLDLARRVALPHQPVADAGGRATFEVTVPVGLSGRAAHLQVLERATCATGPVHVHGIPPHLRAEGLATTVLRGAGPEDGVGSAVAELGDPDGDGVVTLAAGAAAANAVFLWPADAGLVDTSQVARLTGEAQDDRAGTALAAGDLDGDGVADLVVGAPANDRAGTGGGAAFVVRGPVAPGSLANAAAVIVAEAASHQAGNALRIVPDATGDGAPDLLVGAYYADGPTSDVGALYLASGASLTGVVHLSSAAAKITGLDDHPVGDSADAADLDGDGALDLVAGTPRDYTSIAGNGGARVFLGPVAGTVSVASADASFLGEGYYESAGRALAATGDLDGDGDPDLVLGSAGSASAGRVYVVAGGAPSGLLSQRSWTVIEGAVPGASLGSELATADLDGDGFDDLVASSPMTSGDHLGAADVGGVSVFYGPLPAGAARSDEADVTLVGTHALDRLGGSVVVTADTDGDGLRDLLTGSVGTDEPGAAWLLLVP